MQNAPREHSAILSTFIKLPFAIKTFYLFCLFLCGRLRQVLLYLENLFTSSLHIPMETCVPASLVLGYFTQKEAHFVIL